MRTRRAGLWTLGGTATHNTAALLSHLTTKLDLSEEHLPPSRESSQETIGDLMLAGLGRDDT